MSDQPSESPSEVADAHEPDISNDAAPTAQDDSSTTADAVPTGAVQADEQPHEPDDKPGIFRRTGLILVGILLALPVGAVLLFGEGLLLGMFASGLGLLGVRVAPTTDLDAHFTSGALVAKDFGLDQPRSPSSGRRVFSADSAEIDMDVWSSLTGAGVHLERVTMTGGRFEDRVYEHEPVDDSVLVQVPGAEPDVPGPIPDPEDPDWQGWQAWAEQWYERLRPWLDDVAIASGQPEAVPAGPHPHDVTYLPPVVPTSEADAALPRFLIRALLINNLNIGGSGALALRGATLEGANIGAGLVPGGPTTLTLSGPTAAAGDVQAQATLQAGSVALEAVVPAAPVATLVAALPADNDLHAAGMQGTSSLTLRLGLGRGAALDGLFFIEIQDFDLQPTAQASSSVQQAAEAWQKVQQAHGKLKGAPPLVVKWQVALTGTVQEPKISGAASDGLAQAMKELRQQVKALAKQQLNQAKDQVKAETEAAAKDVLQDAKDGKLDADSAKDRFKKIGSGLPSFGR